MKLRYLPLLLLPFATHAQGPVYQVDMQEQKLLLPDANFYVTDVLDLRVNNRTIGRVQRGLSNVAVPADLKGGAGPGLAQWLQAQLPVRPGARPVIMRIHELRIGEVTKATSEKARAVIDVDFVAQQPDSNYYVLFRHTDEQTHGGLETTAFHDDNIAACLQRGLTFLNTLPWEARLRGAAPLSAEQLRYRNGRVPEAYTYPIMTQAPVRGLYPSFLAFRRNQPDTSRPFEVERRPRTGAEWQGTEEIRLYTGGGTGRTEVAEAWGFSDGQQLYIRHRKQFYPLKRVGNDFLFESHAGADAGAVNTAGIVGGLAGSAIAAASTSGHRQEYTLDMASGRVSDFEYLEKLSQRDTATVIIYRRPGSAKKAVGLVLNGKDIGQLPANDFVRIPWTSKTQEITLGTSGEASATCSFIPDFTTITYVEVQAKTDTDQPVLTVVPAKEGVFYTKKMRRHE